MPKTAKKLQAAAGERGNTSCRRPWLKQVEGFHAMLLRITHEQALPTIDNHQSRHAPTFGCGWSKRTVRVIAQQGAKTKKKQPETRKSGQPQMRATGYPLHRTMPTRSGCFFFWPTLQAPKPTAGSFSVVYRSHSASGSRGVLVLLVAAITRLGKLLSQVFNLFLILLQLLRTSAGACAVITS